MREILIISGKGGTGKTSITGAFAHLASSKIVCDLDVDAPDLHLLLRPENNRIEQFYSGYQAEIIAKKCTGCGTCAEMCRFDAVKSTDGGFTVDSLRCEGCKVCVAFCPAGAIEFPQKHCGYWYVSSTRFGPLVHAQLFPGEANSGRLVMVLKQKARDLAEKYGQELVICDGAPGIGCPVISSLSGTNLAVAVTEPTPSGRHDLERVADLCTHFQVAFAVVINKFDLNQEEVEKIEDFCRSRGYPVVAKLPHDPVMTRAMVQGLVVTELPGTEIGRKLVDAWVRISDLVGRDRGAAIQNANRG